jgi:acetate kinase
MKTILTINCGSSSLKFALYSTTLPLQQLESGHVKDAANMKEAVEEVIRLLRYGFQQYRVAIIGHRIVQGGGKHFEPVLLSDDDTINVIVPKGESSTWYGPGAVYHLIYRYTACDLCIPWVCADYT